MTNRINGRSMRNYIGTNASQPPNITFNDHQPSQFDRFNYQVGDLWLYTDPTPGTNYQELWYLASLKGSLPGIKGPKAKWVLLASGNTGNVSKFQMDVGTAEPNDDGIVFNLAGENTNSEGDNIHTMRVNLNRFIEWPTTNAAGDEGVIYLNGQTFLHNFGDNGDADGNTFLGIQAGNLTNIGNSNTGIGDLALHFLTIGINNTAVGSSAGSSITSANNCTFIGQESGFALDQGDDNVGVGAFSLNAATNAQRNTAIGTGSLLVLTGGDANTVVGYRSGFNLFASTNTAVGHESLYNVTNADGNIALGYRAGYALTGTDRFNIDIGNAGVSGDVGVTRIGSAGVHNTAYMAGVTGVTTTSVTPEMVVNVGPDGQLGELELTSSGGTIAITSGVVLGKNTINFESVGGGGGSSNNAFAFSYVQDTDGTAAADTPYLLGANVVMTKLFDDGNNVYPGDGIGANAYFTAPITGKYYLEVYFGYLSALVPASITITTTARSYTFTPDTGAGQRAKCGYSVVTDMTMGDTATFSFLVASSPLTILGQYNPGGNISFINSTRMSGFLIGAGASGGAFSQPFSYLQLTDANFAFNSTYTMGEQVALTQLFDVGNNFYPGDGAGTGAYFEAPETGIYQFEFYVLVTGSGGSTAYLIVSTPARDYTTTIAPDNGTDPVKLFTVITELNITEHAVFKVQGSGTTWNVKGNTVVILNNVTRISGYRIA